MISTRQWPLQAVHIPLHVINQSVVQFSLLSPLNMVSDTPDQNPFAPVADSASAMDDIPVLTPRSSVDSAACGLNAAPLQHVAPPAPAAPAAPPPSFPSAILQTIDIRRHVPVVLDLLAGNHAQWRRHFDTVLGMFGLRAHVDAETVPRPDDPEWQMANHTVIHWLYATISPELLDAIMQPENTALTVWTAVDGIFRDNHLARAVYVDAEYHALVQGDLTVMQYCTKLKSFTDQLRDLGQPVTETRQIFHLLRGLNRQFHAAIPHITSQVPLPSFLQVRSFLLLEEHRAEQSARLQSSHVLVAARGVAPPSPAPSTDNNRGRGRGRRRGRGNGAAVQAPPAPSPAPRPPSVLAPAPGANSWTGLVQAWPVAWRAPGSGVLGPRPGMPPQQAMFAAPHQPALPPYGYGAAGAPGYGAPTGYGHPGAGPSSLPSPAWDMASLQAALHNATAGPSSSGTTPEWYLDSGAATHMSSSPGNLLSVRPHLSASQVIIGSGDCLPIMHVGTGSLIAGTSPLQLRNVLVCPSIIINLLSVRQLCHDNPVSVEFDLFGFSVKDLRTKVVILRLWCNSPYSLLSTLHAHGIRPADENCYHEEERPGEHIESEVYRESSGTGGESGMNVMVVKKSVPPPPAEELEYTKDMGCAAATKAVAVEYTEEERVDGALELYARVEALEADRAATRREVAALRAEPAREVLAREMARRLCRESAAVTMVHKPRFSVLAICKFSHHGTWANVP
ncbi:unnamed protein product [Triticum aestivum]|uniref:Retrovirus-related Pol polyprotein from transposon TNT 1-94-like beta-barrel domain-containing protein n=4 Tax=Triticinae TaxID=1648030 RepID=A0A7H4LGV6_WHEAT|nr:unnamed protein product [Triticum aestivum]